MAHVDPKVTRAKSLGFVSQACIAKKYGGRPNEDARRRFYAAPYGMQRSTDENRK